MNLDSSTIDRIVAGVLNQLGKGEEIARDVFTAESRSRGGSAESSVSREATPSATGDVIEANVVTADVLLGSMNGASQVTVGDRAIVTPAAWDAARERGVEIVRSSPRPMPHGPGGKGDREPSNDVSHGVKPVGLGALMIVVRNTDVVERVSEEVRSCWRREILGCPDDAASLAISTICRGDADTVVIIAEQTHRAACLANRNERVKAVAVADASDARRVRSQIRANVWCIDPTNRSWFELRNLFSVISDN